MNLIIDTRGAKLSKVDERFKVKTEEGYEEYAACNVEQIIITNAVSITSDALQLAVENNVDVVFLNYYGQPYGRVWHHKISSIATIRRRQLELKNDYVGTELVKLWITKKMSNQIDHLMKLRNNRKKDKQQLIDEAVIGIKDMKSKVVSIRYKCIDEVRYKIEGYEGTAGKIYFSALSELIPQEFIFHGRSKNPAKDEFNAMLNYSYGMLYSKVERACILAGLDPYIGIMHTDNYNKTALVFDIIEMYRGIMDETVFKLFSQRKVKKGMFSYENNKVYLIKEGKKLLISAVNERLEESIEYKGKKHKIKNIIQRDCHEIANFILKRKDEAC